MTERYKYSNDGYLNENFRLFHLKDSSGQEKDFHFHEFDKIVILISGKVDYTVEGTTYKLEPWDILLVRHHMIHKAAIDLSVPYERIIIYLDSAYVERFAPNAGLMDCFAEAERRGYCLMRPDENAIAGLKDALGRLEATQDDELFGAQLLRHDARAASCSGKPHHAKRQKPCRHCGRFRRQDRPGAVLYKRKPDKRA